MLRFARDRNAYRDKLRECLSEVDVSLLNFIVTSNHVHLLLRSSADVEEVSRLMQLVQGQHGQAYNRRRNRCGAFWEDRYHATMVEGGSHLWRCLTYIDLNMVRAGVVPHPRDWRWSGYDELMGNRQRYRLIDLEEVQRAVQARSSQEFREHYEAAIEARLAQHLCRREPQWTESIAVGSASFVQEVSTHQSHRQKLEFRAVDPAGDTWLLREAERPYNTF